jgi:AbrB family looped-hinge helix DNA binding protein
VTKISSKNQITIPIDALRKAGMQPGDEVVVRPAARGHLEIVRARDFLEQFAGALPPGTWPPGAARELRREWDR